MNKQLFKTKLITEVSPNDLEGVGTLRWVGDRLFRWVNNATGTDTVVGEVVCHDMSANPDSGLFEKIYKSVSNDLSMMAGVCMSIITDAKFGWIQVFGHCTSALVLEDTGTTTVIGDYLKAVNNDVVATLDSTSQPLYTRNLQALEALTSTEAVTITMNVTVNCI